MSEEEIKETRQEGILFTIDCLKNHKFNFDYCLDELIEETTNLQNQLQQKENIIKEVREEVKIYEEQSNDGATNELDNYVFVQRLKKVLDKGE